MTTYRITIEIPKIRFIRRARRVPQLRRKNLSRFSRPVMIPALQLAGLVLAIVVGAIITPWLVNQLVGY